MSTTLVLLAPELAKHATTIARRCNCHVVPRRTPNPTLVAHGLVAAARWHILTHAEPRKAVADLYVGTRAEAVRVARALSRCVGRPLDLLDNTATPADLRAHPTTTIRNPGRSAPSRGDVSRRVGQLLVAARTAFDKGLKDQAQKLYERAWEISGVPVHNPGTKYDSSGARHQGLNTREQALHAERGLRVLGLTTAGVVKRGKRWHVIVTSPAHGGRRANPKGRKRELSVPEKHQLRVARDSFKYTPEMLRVVGGPSHEEAREIIYRLTGKRPNPRGRKLGEADVRVAIAGLLKQGGFDGLAHDVAAQGADPVKALTIAARASNEPGRTFYNRAKSLWTRWVAGGKRENPSRTKTARAKRRGGLKSRTSGRVYRAAVRAVRRKPFPGNAAQSLYYLQHHQARSAMRKAGLRPNPKGPKSQAYQDGEHDGMITALEGHPIPPFIVNATDDFSRGFKAAYKRTGQGPRANPTGRDATQLRAAIARLEAKTRGARWAMVPPPIQAATYQQINRLTAELEATPNPKRRKNPLQPGEQLSHAEISLIHALYPHHLVMLDDITRKSARQFDITVRGHYFNDDRTSHHKKGDKFGAWLPLARIAVAKWTSAAIANMSDYPEMAREGDWSGIRDSDEATIWRMFEYVRDPGAFKTPPRGRRANPKRHNPAGEAGWDRDIDTLNMQANHGRTKAVREAARRELARRGITDKAYVVTAIHNGTHFWIADNASETATDIPTRAARYATLAAANSAAARARAEYGWAWKVGHQYRAPIANPSRSAAARARRKIRIPHTSGRRVAKAMRKRDAARRKYQTQAWAVRSRARGAARHFAATGRAANPKRPNWLDDLASHHHNDEAAFWRSVENFPAVGSLRTAMLAEAKKAWARHGGNQPSSIGRRANPKGHDPELDAAVRRISAGLRRRSGKSWSVTRGKGSVYGWIYIRGKGGADLDAAERAQLATLLGLAGHEPVHHQGVMIPSGSSERDEFVARAEGHHQGPRRRNPKAALSRRRQVPGRSSPRSGRAVSGRKRSPRVATAKRRKNPAELKVGDRVRYSHHKIESFRRSHSGFNYMKGDRRRATADELMQELLDERGVVLEVHPPHGNVLAYGYKVLWEPSARYPQGITSSSIDSILTREDDPLLKGTGRRRNPRGSNVAAAAKTVRMFQDRGPIPVKAKRMKAPTPLKDTAAELGKLVGVVYRSDKFDGKTRDYEHDFSKPLPSLVTDPEGRGLHVVGGRYKVTPDGIVN